MEADSPKHKAKQPLDPTSTAICTHLHPHEDPVLTRGGGQAGSGPARALSLAWCPGPGAAVAARWGPGLVLPVEEGEREGDSRRGREEKPQVLKGTLASFLGFPWQPNIPQMNISEGGGAGRLLGD